MDFAAQVKNSVDIVKTIGEYVRLKKSGAGPRYVGLCPFHSEKTPSFSVHGGHQFFYCFGCQEKGDVFSFVMKIEGLDFAAALKLIAERNGIPIPRRTPASSREEQARSALAEMYKIAEALFRENLLSPAGAEARAYLAKRGVDARAIERFGLGFSDPSGQQLLRRLESEGFPRDLLESSGLVRARENSPGFYDYFRGRLMFPIHSEAGETIAFGGRALRDADQPKYLNSPETPLYRKSATLYNLNRARAAIRKHGRVILVEGYMDAIGVSSAGVEEVVASCGTALTAEQVRAMRRHTDRVVVNFDPDPAGEKAAERSIELLIHGGLRVQVLSLGDDLDPDEYVKQNGVEMYRSRLDASPRFFHWLFDRARARFGAETMDQRLEAWKYILPSIQRIPDSIERAAVAGDAADFLSIDRAMVLDQLRKAAAAPGTAQKPLAREIAAPVRERLLLKSLLASEEARAVVLPRLATPELLDGLALRPLFEAVLAASLDGGFSYQAVEGRLPDSHRALLAGLCLADEDMGDGEALHQALECVSELEQQSAKMQRASLKNQIKDMTRRGDHAGAMKLITQLNALERGAPRADSGD
jgi:DNA primase